ncbi:hypothetical protein K3495_g9045 [Podosphaera aphanis]|nr:hypothetical protein K3495_g9045 [Podosphaera aphanis]
MALPLPAITIGNLTSTPIELKLYERSGKSGDTGQGIVASAAKAVAKFWSSLTALSKAGEPDTFTSRDVSLWIQPYETRTTDIRKLPDEVMRITFEAVGLRYRIETSKQASHPITLRSLSSDPHLQFTAIHLPHSSHISLFSSARLERWMSTLQDDIPVSALSIPGTHNSPTCYTALPSVRCQAVGVAEQLQNGVRFLDIRVQPERPADPSHDGLILVHSAFPISLTGNKYFCDLMTTVYRFLDASPRETVIISLKREGVGKATDQQLSRILYDHYTRDQRRWFTENRIPLLREVRGKIVLIRRFALDESLRGENDGKGWAIDAESWPDNCADGMCLSGEIMVQDFYEVAQASDIKKKISYSIEQLHRSARSITHPSTALSGVARVPFSMNFLSASNFWSPFCWPDRVAAAVNPKIVDHLCRNYHERIHNRDGEKTGDLCTGIVVCDWVGKQNDWDLVRCIVGMNARLQVT